MDKFSPTNIINQALKVIQDDFLMDKIEKSLQIDFDKASRAHDSIKEFLTLAGKLTSSSDKHSFQKNSAYFLYHWEVCELANRSNLEALSTYYNSSFILLRSSLEFLIRGLFLECLAHKKYRDNASILDSTKQGKKMKKFIEKIIQIKPEIENELESTSGAIFDKLENVLTDKDTKISVMKMLEQLIEWNLLEGIENAKDYVYSLYSRLSLDTHGIPDNLDVGRILIYDKDLFRDRQIIDEELIEYFDTLVSIMDLGMIMTLNLLKENIKQDEIKSRLKELINKSEFKNLKLINTESRIQKLIS